MALLAVVESWGEGLLRITIGAGLVWIGAVERGGYGAFLGTVGIIFIAAGVIEIWAVEAAAHQLRSTTMGTMHAALLSCEIPVFYATTEGQTQRIAQRLVAHLRDKGFSSQAIDVAGPDADYIDWSSVRGALVGASLHAHRHQRAARAFVREYAAELNGRPSMFFSVSLAAASATPGERQDAARMASELPASAGWHPSAVVCFAGRLAYTRYGWLTRFIMKRIARRSGAPIDTSRDYEFTNWDEVARLADSIVAAITAVRPRRAA